jgi:hypothetical protein
MVNGRCEERCPERFYAIMGSCKKCSKDCVECTSETNCTKCRTDLEFDFVLTGGYCKLPCGIRYKYNDDSSSDEESRYSKWTVTTNCSDIKCD